MNKKYNFSIFFETPHNCINFQDAVAISANGVAELINNDKQNSIVLYLEKHPTLSEFIVSSNYAFIRIKELKYQFVIKFQNNKILKFEL
jgi:hypothetical protein